MFFLVSKLFWMVAAPATFLLALTAAGFVLSAAGLARTGRAIAGLGLAGLLAGGVLPVWAALLRPLESRFPRLPDDQPAPTGIIVLGGSTDQALEEARHRVTIADAGDRLTEAVILARRYPEARIVFSGGSAALAGSRDTEAADARRLWTAMGVADARITTEDRSRNTDENVRFSKAVVDPRPGETWVLVTSAFHMPRAVGLFRANGWPVIPDPVDYRTLGTAADSARASMSRATWCASTSARASGSACSPMRSAGEPISFCPIPDRRETVSLVAPARPSRDRRAAREALRPARRRRTGGSRARTASQGW